MMSSVEINSIKSIAKVDNWISMRIYDNPSDQIPNLRVARSNRAGITILINHLAFPFVGFWALVCSWFANFVLFAFSNNVIVSPARTLVRARYLSRMLVTCFME